jgi:hypothetical protein
VLSSGTTWQHQHGPCAGPYQLALLRNIKNLSHVQLDDVLLHVDPADAEVITVKLLCGWAISEDGLFSQSNARASGSMPQYKAPEVCRLNTL